ncbi:TPA: hypothetical protein ACHKNH_000351, partial [Escherichia coli]
QNNGKRGKHSVYAHPSIPDEDNIIQGRKRKIATSISENEIPTITQRIFASIMSLSDMLNPPFTISTQ